MGQRLVRLEVRIELIELPDLAISSPAEIAVPCISQIRARDFLETTCRVEARGDLIGDRLIVNKAVFVCRVYGSFVKILGVEFAAFYASDLCTHQRGAVFKILRAILRPYFELPVVNCQSLEMLLFLIGGCGIPGCRGGKRTIEVKLCQL